MIYIYSNTHERIISATPDQWVTITTARMMSSKMSLCIVTADNDNLTNDDCIQWGLINPGEAKQNQQTPSLLISKFGVEHKGPALDISEDTLKYYQSTMLEVYNIIKSAWITDALYNSANQNTFINLFDDTDFLKSVNDDSGIDGGFLNAIYKIVYFSQSVDEMKLQIGDLFNNEKSSRPTNLNLYKLSFYKFLT